MKKKRIMGYLLIITLLASVISAVPALADYEMPYFIDVDITNQITTIYSTSDGSIVRQMICSSGINGSTPLGVYYMVDKGRASERSAWTWLQEYHCFVKYATRVHLGYMFHSLPYSTKEDTNPQQEAVDALGTPASHGCIRLRWEDAYFIAKNCLTGTRVNFFESGEVDEELRQLLLESSYTNEDGMTYNEFLGYSNDALGRGTGGQEVTDLQHRLMDLGYYEGECLGQYDTDTVNAVKKVQADLGLKQNGITDTALSEILYSDDAPVSSGNTTLQIGSSGPIVKKLQEALASVGVYSGAMDGIYDPEVEDAVKLFQGAANFAADGIATPLLQQILYYECDQIKAACGEDFTANAETEDIVLAKVESETNIIVRSSADSDSDEIAKLKNGDTVIVKAVKGDWVQILTGSKLGYVKKKYLNAYQQTDSVLKFSGSNGEYTIGHTMEEYMNGAESLAEKYANGVPTSSATTNASDAETAEDDAQYVTVSTGSDDVSMNLRQGAGSDAEVIGEVPNGTVLEVIGSEMGWTKVSYNGIEGYLMNDYLAFGEPDIEDDESEDTAEQVTAVVLSNADVYDVASADASRIGSLKSGAVVQVLDMGDGDYVFISCDGHEGYMKDSDLQFQLN